MKSEMDLLKMDRHQRVCWLLANRLTLMIVGICWLGMIAWEITQSRTPVFLIAMVPVFATIRFGLYAFYRRRGVST